MHAQACYFHLLPKSQVQSSYKSSRMVTHPGVAAQHYRAAHTQIVMSFTVLILPRARQLTTDGFACSCCRQQLQQPANEN